MTAVEFAKYVFDFAFSDFWHFLGVCWLLSCIRLVSLYRYSKD
jgi:hypothetical protein